MHSTLMEYGFRDHNNRSYKVHMTKTGCIITRTAHHIKQIQISTELYLCDEITKATANCSRMIILRSYSVPLSVIWQCIHIKHMQKDM